MMDVEPGADSTLADRIADGRGGSEVIQARLTTDERVLARVTDGIYREPSSALRELVSNAYDADATEVIIQTDRPRFSSIMVTDNGNGMSPEVLAHLIEHIGGSAKRSQKGSHLGVTDPNNRFYSPGGRRLIGRIGIGLFSVSQLTNSFQIITKVKGDPWRTVAMVRLRTYDDGTIEADDDTDYEAGLVSIWSVPAEDVSASGTTIVLTDLQRHTVRTLRDADRWIRVQNGEPPPAYHIGFMEDGGTNKKEVRFVESIPWEEGADGASAFSTLVDAVWGELRAGNVRNPSTVHLFDKYLQTVWEIALAAPLPYVGVSPLLLRDDSADRFVLTSDRRQPPELLSEELFTERLGVPEDTGQGLQPFRVFFDNLELRRPVRVEGLPSTSHALKKPLVFAEHVREEFRGVDVANSGGPLEFTGYIMWAPKIAPVEHNGALIRVHGASGTLFDRSFLNYGVAELTRLRQLSCEIFVSQGFESALNIDREGFNQSHPHARRLTAWLHGAIGRAINTQKTLADKARREARAAASQDLVSELQNLAETTWRQQRSEASSPPPVTWARDAAPSNEAVDAIRLEQELILGSNRRNTGQLTREKEQLAAIVQILAAFDLLDDLPPYKINELMKALSSAIRAES
ncbi:ATP-binding protein [Nonomuraea wenchangensis]|uniref:ATP-binding protein n=1 Tax=Nonomuraea wenchangensis TaxID=568860 RepID=UPI003328EF45